MSSSPSASAPPARSRRARVPRQLALPLRTWGGRRAGAGRKPKGAKAGVSHEAREALSRHHPVHVTLKVVRGLPSLRHRKQRHAIWGAFAKGKARFGLRLVHFSVQRDHVHLVLEAEGRESLTRGMQGLTIRIARALNAKLERKGRVFADRYHAHVLKTPREVRNALGYVLTNAHKHREAVEGQSSLGAWAYRKGPDRRVPRRVDVDPCSSGLAFDGWRPGVALDFREAARELGEGGAWVVVPPNRWLLQKGWRRAGLLDPRRGVGEVEATQP